MAKTETEIINIGGQEITFYPNSHIYKIDGEKIPSVTSILGIIDKSQQLIWWAVGCMRDKIDELWTEDTTIAQKEAIIAEGRIAHNEKKEKAGDRGTAIHEWIDQWIVDKKTPIPKDDELIVSGITAFLKWQKENKAEFLKGDTIVYNGEQGYIGKADAIAMVDGKKTLIDFKSGKDIYKESIMQVSAYWEAYEMSYKEDIEQGLIIHFDKETAEFKTKYIDKELHAPSYTAFMYAKSLKELCKEVELSLK